MKWSFSLGSGRETRLMADRVKLEEPGIRADDLRRQDQRFPPTAKTCAAETAQVYVLLFLQSAATIR
jgi:hypothetical protein